MFMIWKDVNAIGNAKTAGKHKKTPRNANGEVLKQTLLQEELLMQCSAFLAACLKFQGRQKLCRKTSTASAGAICIGVADHELSSL